MFKKNKENGWYFDHRANLCTIKTMYDNLISSVREVINKYIVHLVLMIYISNLALLRI